MTWTTAEKLAAIRARTAGEWGHPALRTLGPLHPDPRSDIARILDGEEPPCDARTPERDA
jgi:hypothetical protein